MENVFKKPSDVTALHLWTLHSQNGFSFAQVTNFETKCGMKRSTSHYEMMSGIVLPTAEQVDCEVCAGRVATPPAAPVASTAPAGSVEVPGLAGRVPELPKRSYAVFVAPKSSNDYAVEVPTKGHLQEEDTGGIVVSAKDSLLELKVCFDNENTEVGDHVLVHSSVLMLQTVHTPLTVNGVEFILIPSNYVVLIKQLIK
jgi:hypothetical protein